MIKVRRLSVMVCLSSVLGAMLSACGAVPESEQEDEMLGEAQLSLTQVPSGVLCIRVVATGSSTVTTSLPVTAGSSTASLNVGRLPLGTTQFSASAFDVACASVTASTAPSWIADPASAVLRPGVATTVSLAFHANNPVTVNAGFVPNIGSVAAGRFATYIRMADGTLRFSGADTLGGVTATPTTSASFGLSNIAEVGSGMNLQCARSTSGAVACWGYVNSPNGSPLGMTPVNLPSPAVQLSVGESHACAVLQSGDIACWGNQNNSGELGNGTTTPAPASAPVLVSGVNAGNSAPARVFAGWETTCVLLSIGSVYCWGNNSSGQFGNGNTTSSTVPVQALSNLNGVVEMAFGSNHGCARRGDGAAFCWGGNYNGELGDGTTTTRLTPVRVQISNVSQIAAGWGYTCAVSAGTAMCWGDNRNGQLGDGTGVSSSLPVAVAGLGTVTAVRAASPSVHSCAEMADQSVYCWGTNNAGQLGTGDHMPHPTPVKMLLQ